VTLQEGSLWEQTGTGVYGLLDANRLDGETTTESWPGVAQPSIGRMDAYIVSEPTYFDFDNDGKVSDDERDEDADGLTNYDELHGRMTPVYWVACYEKENPYPVRYAGTSHVNADTDGDGLRDGLDDVDHDDVPNVMELSRNAASGLWDASGSCNPLDGLPSPPNEVHHPDAYGMVNPFNPCLPATYSRTCLRHPQFDDMPAPFVDSTPLWYALN